MEARRHRLLGLQWCELYRSLALWSHLTEAVEDIQEFQIATTESLKITDFYLLKRGFIAIVNKSAIKYLNVLTRKEGQITRGMYKRYAETNNYAILLNFNNGLVIERKVVLIPEMVPNVWYDHVNKFVLLDHIVVMVTTNNKLFYVDLDEEEFGKLHIPALKEPVLCAGLNISTIYVLTYRKKIYKLIDGVFTLAHIITQKDDLLNILLRYNLTHDMDWLVYKRWLNFFGKEEPITSVLGDITAVKKYGKIVIIGTKWSDVFIYHVPRNRVQVSLYTQTPVKSYNLSDCKPFPKFLNSYPIIQLDVLEGKDQHFVVVATPNEILVITLQHVTTGTEEMPVLMEESI